MSEIGLTHELVIQGVNEEDWNEVCNRMNQLIPFSSNEVRI